MKRRLIRSVAVVALVLVSAAVPASQSQTPLPAAAQPNFLGEWRNTQIGMPYGAIPTIRVTEQDGELKIQAWGLCMPQHCEWPVVRFWSLRDVASKEPDRGFATFPDGKHLILRMDGSEMVVELYQTSDVKISNGKTRTQFVTMRYVRAK